jgi:transglutaminase-like putative cysteine protease
MEAEEQIAVEPSAGITPVEQLPPDALQFLLQSRYCPSDKMEDKAREIVGDLPPGYPQVEAIRTWIESSVTYEYGVSTTATSVLETLQQRAGVCRDFAHLGIAMCRSIDIPARMVVGYLHELVPMDQHAWFEAYIGGRWFTFDATQRFPRGNRVAVAYGRDAADVAIATQYGSVELTEMMVSVVPSLSS